MWFPISLKIYLLFKSFFKYMNLWKLEKTHFNSILACQYISAKYWYVTLALPWNFIFIECYIIIIYFTQVKLIVLWNQIDVFKKRHDSGKHKLSIRISIHLPQNMCCSCFLTLLLYFFSIKIYFNPSLFQMERKSTSSSVRALCLSSINLWICLTIYFIYLTLNLHIFTIGN